MRRKRIICKEEYEKDVLWIKGKKTECTAEKDK